MDVILQVWGGGCYLLNKILFALGEGRSEKGARLFKLIGWVVYILGVPAWVIILVGKQNWIAASLEAGALPAMFLGLYVVWLSLETTPRTFDRIAGIFTYVALIFGTVYSFIDYGGLTSLSQILEIGSVGGFLFGSLLLARGNRKGWLFFMLMNGSMGALMLIQGKPFLTVQQAVSLGFVVYGYIKSARR
ncbi:MAG: nicotinamide mononucleotide transporter [Spirochaetales bacterium]|nr:nicotinamide mononucleotide transporter [Spirochaetales bacterium]